MKLLTKIYKIKFNVIILCVKYFKDKMYLCTACIKKRIIKAHCH